MENISIFELASRQKTRFMTNRGEIVAEQLWDMPLTSKTGFDLDTIGQRVIGELDNLKTRSLVNTKPNPRVAELDLQLEIIKYVIGFKVTENQVRLDKAKKTEERNKLIELLGKKQEAALGELSEEEIKKRLAALDE